MEDEMNKTKIIIDTDIGDDIDDALAIALALESPELEIMGITTVFKNVTARARLAARMLKMAGRADIPVFAGLGRPIVNQVDLEAIPCQYSEVADGQENGFSDQAIDFIIETVMKSESDITLVPIGPLTNIAVAILKEPQLRTRVKAIVMMAGCFYTHCNEWNVRCDPEAARIVFDSGIPIKAIGLDVTFKCQLSKNDVDKLSASTKPSARYLPELIKRWRQGGDKCPFMHDPLAVCAIFDQTLLDMRHERIVVETQGEYMRGATYNTTGFAAEEPVSSHIMTARTVNAEGFIRLFLDRTCG